MTPIIGDLIQNTVGKVVGKLVDKYLPPALSDKEKEEFRLKAMELALEGDKNLQSQLETINATMREEAKSEHFLQWSWRPLIGYTFALVIINNFIIAPLLGFPQINIPGEVWNSILVILGASAFTRGWKQVEEVKKK